MKTEELAVIKERASKYEMDMTATLSNEYRITKVDVPELVAEVERLQAKLSECESLLGNAYGLLDDVHCYETETYEAITEYFYGEEDE